MFSEKTHLGMIVNTNPAPIDDNIIVYVGNATFVVPIDIIKQFKKEVSH